MLPGSTSGPRRILNDNEEEELVAFLRRCASVGSSKSRKELLALVQAIAESKGTQHLIIGWMVEFFYQETPRYYTKSPSAFVPSKSKGY